jgi:hypothetical protein
MASGMTHQRVAGHDGEAATAGSPDLEFALAESSTHLADFKIGKQ